MSGPNQGEEWLRLVLARVKTLPDTEDYFDRAFQIAGEFALTMRITFNQMDEFYEMLVDMDNEAQIRRIGVKAYCRQLCNKLTKKTLDYDDTRTELLASAEMYSDLEKEHKSCAVRISDLRKRLQSSVDKNSDLERQLRESREETARLKSELQEREAAFAKKADRSQETFQNFTQAEEQEVQDTKEESARLGPQLQKASQDHSQCASYPRELKDVIDQPGDRLDQTGTALERKCTKPGGDIPVAGSDWEEYSLHDAKQAYHRLEMVNDDLKKQLAEIETYVESFVRERHGVRNTTQATPEVDQRREKLRKSQKGTGTKS